VKCPKCCKETPDELYFCFNCGANISKSNLASDGISSPKKRRKSLFVVAGFITVALLFGTVYAVANQNTGSSSSSTFSFVIPQEVRRVVYPDKVCNVSTPVAGSAGSVQTENNARYDSQYLLGFFDNHRSLSINVTAKAQIDEFGFGPVYLLNGLSDKNYWYQLGVSYNVGFQSAPGHSLGFSMGYMVWNAQNNTPIYPPSGRGSAAKNFSGTVGVSDEILLSLKFQNGNVNMSALDWNTSSFASVSFPSFDASAFLGSDYPSSFFSGLMTEWYHVDKEFCSSKQIVYTNFAYPTNYAWICTDELDKTLNYSELVGSCPYQLFYFKTNSSELQGFSYGGAILYGNAFEFVTP